MIQIYPVSLAYLFLSGLFYYSIAMPGRFKAVVDFRLYLAGSRFRSLLFFYFGLVLALLNLLLPIPPGPVIAGDFTVAVALYVSSYALKAGDKAGKEGVAPDPTCVKRNMLKGHVLFAVAVLHLVFPSFIII